MADLIVDFWASAPQLLPLLGAKPHRMALSEIETMIHQGCGEGRGIPLACHPLAAHMTFATPDALTERHPTAWHQRYNGRAPLHNNSIAISYLGHIHRVIMQHRAQLLAKAGVAAQKQLLASMSFAHARGVQLRTELVEQCNAEPSECWHMHYSGFAEVVESYRSAWFCVQPYGDCHTRSALLDCQASGLAVPAVFDEYLLDMLPFADVVDYRSMVAYVAEEDVMPPYGNLLRQLRALGNDTRGAMMSRMQQTSHAFQYPVSLVRGFMAGSELDRLHVGCVLCVLALECHMRVARPRPVECQKPRCRAEPPGGLQVQPNQVLMRLDSLSLVHPLDDAFTMSFKAVLRHACRRAHHHCHQAEGGSYIAGRLRG